MPGATQGRKQWWARWADEPYAYLTTAGRRSGQPHRIEIWFAVHDGRIYLMSGARDRSDWVRNLMADPRVTIEVGGEVWSGNARIIEAGTAQDALARDLLVAKYATATNPLDRWKQRSLPVIIQFPIEDD